VFLFKYGVRIMGKIEDAITPLFSDVEPIDPFDPNDAQLPTANQRNGASGLRQVQLRFAVSDWREDVIARVRPAALSGRDHAPSQFKSYDELKRKFDLIVGTPKAA